MEIMTHKECAVSNNTSDLFCSNMFPLVFRSRTLALCPEMSLLTGPDNTGGCQSALVGKLGVSLSQYHHPWSTSQVTGDEQKARRGHSSETSVSSHRSQSTNLGLCPWAVRTDLWLDVGHTPRLFLPFLIVFCWIVGCEEQLSQIRLEEVCY
jgi:hypothetical protein